MHELIRSDITRYIGVELNPTSRTICDNVNSPELSEFGGVDHSWKSNVFNIQESDIISLGHNTVKQLVIAAPCEEISFQAAS